MKQLALMTLVLFINLEAVAIVATVQVQPPCRASRVIVYLKDGSVHRGVIVEQIPNESLRIRQAGGRELTFQMADVLKITQELPMPQNTHIERREPAVAQSFSTVDVGRAGQRESEKSGIPWFKVLGSIGIIFKGIKDDDTYLVAIGGICGLINGLAPMFSVPISAEEMDKKARKSERISRLADPFELESNSSPRKRGILFSIRF